MIHAWENARGPGLLGDPGRGIPTLLDPVQGGRAGTPTPLRAGTPFRPGPPPTPHLHLFGKGQGARVPARKGVAARCFLELWAVRAWEYHKPGPPTSRDPFLS